MPSERSSWTIRRVCAKKIGLSVALLHNPQVLILDEPFEAIDPVSGLTLERILTGYVALGGSVLLSGHVMGAGGAEGLSWLGT